MAFYVQIQSVSLPQSAAPGNIVQVVANIKNLYGNPVGVKVAGYATGVGGWAEELFTNYSSGVDIAAGATVQFTSSFTMHSVSADVWVFTWWKGADLQWHYDDQSYSLVQVSGGGTEVGAITMASISVPTSAVVGSMVNVSIDVRNDYPTAKNIYSRIVYEGVNEVTESPGEISIPAGGTQRFSGSFVMPDANTQVLITIYCQLVGVWQSVIIESGNVASPLVTQLSGMSVNTAGGSFTAGAQVPFTLMFNYKGIAQTATLTVIIGSGAIFNPVVTLPSVTIQLPYYNVLSAVPTINGVFTIPTSLTPGSYSIRTQVVTADGVQSSDDMYGAFVVTGGGTGETAGFTLIRDKTYDLASTYYGQAEKSTVTWSVLTPSFMLSSDKIDSMVTNFDSKFAEKDAHMLSLKLYEKSGAVKTDYLAYFVTTVPTSTTASSTYATLSINPLIFGIDDAVFIAIIIAVCLIVGLIIILVTRKSVSQFLFGNPSTGTTGMMGMIEMMIMVMMMSMMMEVMNSAFTPEGQPPKPMPVTHAVVSGVKQVGKGVKYVAEKAVPVVGGLVKSGTEYIQRMTTPTGKEGKARELEFPYIKEE